MHIFCVEDGKNLQIQNENIIYHKYAARKGFFNKIIKHSFFWNQHNQLYDIVLNRIRKLEIHYIIAHDLPTLKPALKIKNKIGAPLLYDSLEIYTETINQFFPKVSGPKKIISMFLIRFMRYFGARSEGKMMLSCEKITTVNNSLATYFSKKYRVDHIEVIMNCPRTKNCIPENVDFRNLYGFKKKDILFIYQGVLNEGRGLNLLIKAFSKISKSHNDIKLIILGDGVLKSKLNEQVNEFGLNETVVFHDSVVYDRLLEYTVAADFGVNLLEACNLSKKYASPNKLFEYMQAGLPVLCSYSPENNLIFNKYNIGIQCKNEVEDISKKIIELKNLKDSSKQKISTELLKAKEIYCWENQEFKLFELIK